MRYQEIKIHICIFYKTAITFDIKEIHAIMQTDAPISGDARDWYFASYATDKRQSCNC